MRPQFNPEEEFVIAYYRQADKSSHNRVVMADLVTVIFGAALVIVGLNSPDFTWALVGFALVSWRLLRNLFAGPRFHDATATAIRKYEAALEEHPPQEDAGPSPQAETRTTSS